RSTCDVQRDVLVDQFRVGNELGQGLFEVSHIGVDIAADQLDNLVEYFYFLLLHLSIEDGDPRLVVGRLQIDVQTPLEPAAQPVGEAPDLRDRSIRRED